MTESYRAAPQRSPGLHKTATLGISVGQDYHEGVKLEACLEWIDARYDRKIICVGDTAQRYWRQIAGLGAQDALLQARAAGSLWLARYGDELAARGYTIHRWDEWLQHSDFPAIHAGYAAIDDLSFNAAIAADVGRFLDTKSRPVDNAGALCRSFIIEELSVHTLQGRIYPGARLYPGSHMAIMDLVKSGTIAAAPPGLDGQQFTQLNLRRVVMKDNRSTEPASLRSL